MKIDIYNTDKKYQIIYADPAGKYKSGTKNRFVNNKYLTDTKEELMDLPVKNLADKNAVLVVGTTYPKLDWCFDIIKAGGFTYKTCLFTGVKLNKKNDKIFTGMGYYTRSNAEICLLATKGKPLKRLTHSISQIVMTHLEEHSKKPACVRDKIVELFGDLPRVELFARQSVNGWDCWGNEVE